jgi:hypothetical protein
VVAGATAEDGASVDGSKSLYDEDDYSDDEDSGDYSEDEDDENFGYNEDDEFRSDIDLGSSDKENYRLEDAGDSGGSVKCRETNEMLGVHRMNSRPN